MSLLRRTLSLHLNNPLQLHPASLPRPGSRRRHSATRMPQNGLRPSTFPHRHQALRCLPRRLRTRVLPGGPSLIASQGSHRQCPLHQRPYELNLMALLITALSLFRGLGSRAAPGDQLPAHKLHYLRATKRKNPDQSNSFLIVTPSNSHPVSELFSNDMPYPYSLVDHRTTVRHLTLYHNTSNAYLTITLPYVSESLATIRNDLSIIDYIVLSALLRNGTI